MTIEEYMDAEKFPATTQEGLTPPQQLMIDASNYDSLKEFFEDGGSPDAEQQERWKELKAKMKNYKNLVAEAAKSAKSPNLR